MTTTHNYKLCLVLLFCFSENVLKATGTLSDVNSNLNLVLLENLASGQEKNALVSPFSLLNGLGILYEGMADSSRSRVAIGFPKNHETFLKMFKTEGSFSSPTKTTENLIVIDANKEINRDFALELNNSMNAIAFKSNLSTEPDKALYSINKRVKSKTRGKIVKFLAAGSITPETSLVLINVLYFNGKWKKEFNNKMETQTFFKLQNNLKTRISADYMYGEMSAGYHKTPTGTEIISIPFEDENYSMVFVVPKTDVKSYINSELRSSTVQALISNPKSLEQRVLSLWLPKFSVSSKLTLKEALRRKPEFQQFFSDSADYSRMARQRVEVNEIHHTAVMDVTQGGVEAAAATGVTVTLYSAFYPDVEVVVDRPFLHFIVEQPTNMILFSGFVNDPRE